jgi:hypothetical protein
MLGPIQRFILAGAAFGPLLLLAPHQAKAWGDEGHKVVALIAYHYLSPSAKSRVDAMLTADTDSLTAHDIASEATWADKYRDSDRNTTKERYNQTNKWHYVDIEIDHPDLDTACFGHPALPSGTPATQGSPEDCVVDKINEFSAELSAAGTSSEERLDALKFVLHFVGDLHQPLHASDNNDQGGNKVKVSADGFRPGNLHHFWDTEFVGRIDADPKGVADSLGTKITNEQVQQWSSGTPADWAQEAFALGKADAYGMLGAPTSQNTYQLSPAYVQAATSDTGLQLSRAGVRLAAVLNKALSHP